MEQIITGLVLIMIAVGLIVSGAYALDKHECLPYHGFMGSKGCFGKVTITAGDGGSASSEATGKSVE